MTKSIDFRNLFIVMILKSYFILTTSFLQYCLVSEESTTEGLLLLYLACRLIFENNLREFSTFFRLILFNIRNIDHRGFVLIVCLVCRLNLKIFKRILMTKTIDFRNLFVIIILKSLCYCVNFSLLILFSTRRVDNRRFVISLFSL